VKPRRRVGAGTGVPDAAGEPDAAAEAAAEGASDAAADGAADGAGDAAVDAAGEPPASADAGALGAPDATDDAVADVAADGRAVAVAGGGVVGARDGGSVSDGPGVRSESHAYLGPVAAYTLAGPLFMFITT